MSVVDLSTTADGAGQRHALTVVSDRSWVLQVLGVVRVGSAPCVIVDLGGPDELTVPHITADSAVVAISVIGAGTHGYGHAALVGQREQRLRSAHPAAVVLRCAPVVEELAIYASPAAQLAGVFHAHPLEPSPWVAAADVAAVVDAVATAGADRAGATYDVTGEHLATAQALLEAMGIPSPNVITGDDLHAALVAAGHPTELVRFVTDQQVWAGTPITPSSTVRRAAGRPPVDPMVAARALVSKGMQP